MTSPLVNIYLNTDSAFDLRVHIRDFFADIGLSYINIIG